VVQPGWLRIKSIYSRTCDCHANVLVRPTDLRAEIETLDPLRELGMTLSETSVTTSALTERVNTLQRSVAEPRCPTSSARLGHSREITRVYKHTCAGAARGAPLALLHHLRSEGCAWEEAYIASCTQWKHESSRVTAAAAGHTH
jgi:hypothetical protein